MNALIQEDSLDFALPSLDLTRFSEPRASSTVGEKYLVFFLGGEFYAIPSENVAEATPSVAVTTLPNAPEWLLGIANLRGEVISVLNLPALLGKEETKFAPKSKFIILRSQIFEFDAAFTADRISEIVILSGKEIISFADEKSPHIRGKALYKSKTLNLIDTEKLLASLKI